MAILQIPTRTDSDNYSVNVLLEGQTYAFTFVWNYRGSFWEMSIAGVVDGLAVCVGANLLDFVAAAGKPPGQFVAVDTSGQSLDPGLHDLGGRIVLLYRESTTT
jgi:hypothetical protein